MDSNGNGTPVGTATPFPGVDLAVTQDGVVVLEQEDLAVDEEGGFVATLQLPEDLAAGPIVISVTNVPGAEPLQLQISSR